MLIIGLTGPSGAGKGEIAKIMEDAGFFHIDGDALSRKVTMSGSPCLKDLEKAFGQDIITREKTLDRKMLAGIAFKNKKNLSILNSIVHPYIKDEAIRLINICKSKGKKGAVIDGAALYESGLTALCHTVIYACAPLDVRLSRIMQRDNITESQALLRINAQPDHDFYNKIADHIIVNDGDFTILKENVTNLVKTLEKEYTNE